jgi:uncharacterized protein
MELREARAERANVAGYGDGGFRIGGVFHQGSVLIIGDRVLPWAPLRPEEVTIESLAPVIAAARDIDILVLGCGTAMMPMPRELREPLHAYRIALEPMNTGAACRTYNLLLAEHRSVAAALIAVA